jgi:hypothetical protein
MGLSPSDLVDLKVAFDSNMDAMFRAITAAGLFSFQQFYTTPGIQYPMCAAPLAAQATCVRDFQALCSPSSPVQSRAVLAAFHPNGCTYSPSPPDFLQDLASFLLWRGPYAWLGTSWIGCGNPDFAGDMAKYPQLNYDYGTPLGLCRETAPGVFSRNYTKASVSMDCASWKGSITLAGV